MTTLESFTLWMISAWCIFDLGRYYQLCIDEIRIMTLKHYRRYVTNRALGNAFLKGWRQASANYKKLYKDCHRRDPKTGRIMRRDA